MEKIIDSAYRLYNQALELIKESNLSDAVKQLKESIRLYSKDPEILNVLGLCSFSMCNFQEARYFWSKSMQISAEDNRAKVYLQTIDSNKFKEMINQYNHSLQKINNNQVEEAVLELQRITHHYSNLIEPYILLGLCNYHLGRYEEAEKNWLKAWSYDQGNIKVKTYLYSVRNIINVKDTVNKNTATDSRKTNTFSKYFIYPLTGATIFLLLAFTYKHISYKQIKSQFVFITEQEINSRKETQRLKEAVKKEQQEKKQLEVRIKELNHLEKNLPIEILTKNEKLTFNEALKMYRNSLYKNALIKFRELVDYSTQSNLKAEALYFTARCFEKTQDYDSAIKVYQDYIVKYPNTNYYDDSLYYCSLLLYYAGHTEDAKKQLTKLIQNQPESIFINSKAKMILEK